MKRAIVAGPIAGFVSGVVDLIFSISGLFGMFSVFPAFFPVDTQTLAINFITVGVIWGSIWGILYALFYEHIPAKGIKKGIVYGLIIWLIAPLNNWTTSAAFGYYLWAIPYAVTSFFSICITYGILIGYLYKK